MINLKPRVESRKGREVASRRRRLHFARGESATGKSVRIVFVALAVLIFGCCKNTVTSPNAQGLTGTWQASKAEYVKTADQSVTYDVVANGGTATLVLTSTAFTLTIARAGAAPQPTSGTWTSTSDILTLTPSGVSFQWVFEMIQTGNNLTLTGAHMEFDFKADGTNEQATLNLTLVRP